MIFKNAKNFIILFLLSIIILGVRGKSSPKIAIIGAGIGGTSCAYFLNKLFNGNADITVYERNLVGGRLNLVHIDSEAYEGGGAIIHPRNKYMKDFANLFKLGIQKPSSNAFGIYDGSQFLLEESDWYVVNIAKFIWRYGTSFLELWKDVIWTLDKFSRIYGLQDSGYSFTSVNKMLEYMNENFRNMTQVSLLKQLEKKKFSKLFLDELVQSVMMVNYGQTNNISAFAGFVSLAGADNNLWSVGGGNKLVPERLVLESGAQLSFADVLEVALTNASYSVTFKKSENIQMEYYDLVILATPLIKGQTNIKFTNFKKDMKQYEIQFHRTVATFIKGSLNPTAFSRETVPDEILVCKPNELFNSIGKVSPVSGNIIKTKNKVYKVFSGKPLEQKNVHQYFNDVEIIKEKDWLAYPHYNPPDNVPPFMIYPGLYYINAIEVAASAMEMSVIGAKNVALLAYNLWFNLLNKVDHFHRVFKEEL